MNTVRLFWREQAYGLQVGGQHRYLLSGLALGITLLLLLQIGLIVLDRRIHETLLGRAGGARLWMDTTSPFTKQDLDAFRKASGLRIYPYFDITYPRITPIGYKPDLGSGFRGRLLQPEHPLAKVLTPVGGETEILWRHGFVDPFGPQGSTSQTSPSEEHEVFRDLGRQIFFVPLRVLAEIEWEEQRSRAPAILHADYELLSRLSEDCRIRAWLGSRDGMDFLFAEGLGSLPPPVVPT